MALDDVPKVGSLCCPPGPALHHQRVGLVGAAVGLGKTVSLCYFHFHL